MCIDLKECVENIGWGEELLHNLDQEMSGWVDVGRWKRSVSWILHKWAPASSFVCVIYNGMNNSVKMCALWYVPLSKQIHGSPDKTSTHGQHMQTRGVVLMIQPQCQLEGNFPDNCLNSLILLRRKRIINKVMSPPNVLLINFAFQHNFLE